MSSGPKGQVVYINMGSFRNPSWSEDKAQQMASMAADRYKLLHGERGMFLNWPAATYLTGVQKKLLVEQLREEKAAAREAAEKGYRPPPALAVQTEADLWAVVKSARSVREGKEPSLALNSRPPDNATFTAWLQRYVKKQQRQQERQQKRQQKRQQAAAAANRPVRKAKRRAGLSH
jgi:hypothetical protein